MPAPSRHTCINFIIQKIKTCARLTRLQTFGENVLKFVNISEYACVNGMNDT